MRSSKQNMYPLIRRSFTTEQELADTLNKSRSYVTARLNGKRHWTHRDKTIVLNHLNEPIDKLPLFFPDYGEEVKSA